MSVLDPKLHAQATPVSALLVTDIYFAPHMNTLRAAPAPAASAVTAQGALAQMFDYFGADLD